MNPQPKRQEEQLADLLHELRHLWHAMIKDMHHPGPLEGLQRQQYWVLGALAHGPRRMSEIAECSQTSQTSLTGIIDRLEERGLVERTRSDFDRRVVEVRLTAQGTTLVAQANMAMRKRLDELLAPLDEADRAEFLRLVRAINAR